MIQRAIPDDDTGGMDAHTSGHAFEEGGVLPKLLGVAVILDGSLELRILFHRLLKVDVQLIGDHLGQPVAVAIAPTEHATHIANHALRTHGAEGNDVAHAALTVFLPDVLDHLGATSLTEVDIKVRRTDTLGVQETLEHQLKTQRINVGNAQGISHQGTRTRTTTRPNRDALLTRPLDEVPNDQEVRREVFVLQQTQFHLHALVDDVIIQSAIPTVTTLKSQHRLVTKVFVALTAVGRVKLRVALNTRRVEMDFEITALSDFQGGITGLRHLREKRAHLLRRFEIDLRRVGHAVLIMHVRIRADADHDIVTLVICAVQKMHVIGRHRLQPELLPPLDHLARTALLLLHPMIVQFEVKILRAENLPELDQTVLRLIRSVREE